MTDEEFIKTAQAEFAGCPDFYIDEQGRPFARRTIPQDQQIILSLVQYNILVELWRMRCRIGRGR